MTINSVDGPSNNIYPHISFNIIDKDGYNTQRFLLWVRPGRDGNNFYVFTANDTTYTESATRYYVKNGQTIKVGICHNGTTASLLINGTKITTMTVSDVTSKFSMGAERCSATFNFIRYSDSDVLSVI